jgi:serine/threonine-protein kinase
MNFGRYRIVKEVGRGAMGVVYQAEDPNLDLVVALKVLRQDRLANEAFVRRFLSEAKALGRLDHPNIVRVFNVDRDGDTVYIAMEFIEGESLASLMKQRPFPPESLAEFGATVAEALDSAHRKGIVHRDVKPSNILLKADGRFKITDFGIARIEDPSAPEQTQAGEILGTPAYMSPEQVLSRPVDGRSDLFSLGIILYELATGVRPFGGEGIHAIFSAITHEKPLEVLARNPDFPKALSDVIMKCLRKKPEERYADGRELARALRAAVGRRESSDAAAQRVSPRYLVPALLILLILGAAGGTWYYFSSRDTVVRTLPERGKPTGTVKTALLNVESTPVGARVFIDGTLQGIAPVSLKLAQGKHEVRMSLTGYYEWEAQVDLGEEAAQPLSVTLVPMEQK